MVRKRRAVGRDRRVHLYLRSPEDGIECRRLEMALWMPKNNL